MNDKRNLGVVRIKYEGIFDWERLYNTFLDFFREKKYDFYETKNVSKIGTYGYEMEYEALGEREETNYVRNAMEIKIKGNNVEDVEVIENGEKKKKKKASMIRIDLFPSIEMDWKKQEKGNGRWDQTPFRRKMRDFFHRYIIRRKIEQWEEKMYYEAYELQTKLKEVLDFESKSTAYPWRKGRY